jgi:hypothetical protein
MPFSEGRGCQTGLDCESSQWPVLTIQRHLVVRYFWLKEIIKNREIGVDYLNIGDMVADGFTKGLEHIKHQKFLSRLSIISLTN